MQIVSQCRIRTIFLSSLSVFLLLTGYILWPWCYASWIWRKSNIDSLDFPRINVNDSIVPAIIHQTWRNAYSIPENWQQASNSCRALHSNYQYRFWSDREARRLIAKEFPCLLETFDAYPYDIQRADVIRLVVLYVYGGIYLDLDIVCLKSLDQLRTFPFVLPRTRPIGLSNDFIVAQAKHPFLLQVLNDLPWFNRRILTKYATVMFTTGPMFLTHEATFSSERSSISILSQELYGKYVHNSSRSLFKHLKASSWHGNDAAFVKWIYHRRMLLLSGLILSLFMTFALLHLIQYHPILLNILANHFSMIQSISRKQSAKYEKIRSNYI